MPRNTKILLRRGMANQWSGNTLDVGEIGYEIDTGRFKIGRSGITSWDLLPYAGGSALISETGIGLIFNESNNAYTMYSFITGAAGGQDGISFQTLPLSGLLNNTSASGTYYRISLSSKLEDLQDSLFTFKDNILASTGNVGGTGIAISGFNNSTIALNPNGGNVTASGIDIRNLTSSITVTSGIGGLTTGTTLTTASGITDILKKMLESVFEPTVGSNPDFTVSLSAGTTSREVGTTLDNFTISATNVSSGTIRGAGLGAAWNASATQRSLVGVPTGYIINNVNVGMTTSSNIGTVTVAQGTNSFGITVGYTSGTLPVNSLGNISTSQNWTNLTAATSVSRSNSFTGFRGLFFGWDKGVSSVPSTSTEIRNLNSVTATASGTMVNPSRPYTINLSIPEGTLRVVVAVPSGYANLGSGISVINAANVGETYSTTVVNVLGNNSYAAIPYFVHSYIPAAPFGANTTHAITVQ